MTPSGDETSGRSPSSPGSASRAGFRREADHLVLTNPLFSISLSATDGAIVSLYNRRAQVELINASEARAHGVLWRFRLATDDGESAPVTSRTCSEFSHSIESDPEGNLKLWLGWSGLRVGSASVDGRVAVAVSFPANASTAWCEFKAHLPGHLAIGSLDFPCICAVGASDLLTDEALFLPLSGGVIISEPRIALAARGWEASWHAIYPGPASMQFLGFSSGDRTTAWLGSADSSGARKTLSVARMAASNRLLLSISQQPLRDPDDVWSPGYPSGIGVVPGDWFEAAREYRAWAIKQPWCARGRGGERGLPPLASSHGLWLSHWGSARNAVAAVRELQRAANVPIKLDWRCWHRCACAGAYPDYFPPRDGEQAFADGKQRLAESGVPVGLSFSGLLASPESEAWQSENAAAYAAQEAQPAGLVAMCPSTEYWQQKLAGLAHEAVRRGAEGVYFADLASAEPLRCKNSGHGHGTPAPDTWAFGVSQALAAVRAAIGRSVALSVDGPNEAYLHLVDAIVSSHAAAERDGAFFHAFGSRWSPIPLFSSVYHGYTALISPGASLVSHRPHDPLSASSSGDLQLPAHVMGRDFPGQFCLEVARAAVWGHQLMLAGFSPEQALSDTNRRKLAFLSAVLRAQSWGVGALLTFAEFMGLVQIESAEVEMDLLVNPPGSDPSERRVVRRSIPPVLGSAWRTPGSGLALVLVNIHEQPVDFAARLRSSRLGLNLPIQLIGQAFSEDGDVPAARLRASGTEISGRLPTRSIVLLTLR